MENGAVHTLTHTVKYSILQVCRVLLSFGGLARRKLGFANTRLRNRHLPGWRFHFTLTWSVTVYPRIWNVTVIVKGIGRSPPLQRCSQTAAALPVYLVVYCSKCLVKCQQKERRYRPGYRVQLRNVREPRPVGWGPCIWKGNCSFKEIKVCKTKIIWGNW